MARVDNRASSTDDVCPSTNGGERPTQVMIRLSVEDLAHLDELTRAMGHRTRQATLRDLLRRVTVLAPMRVVPAQVSLTGTGVGDGAVTVQRAKGT
jgi:hypothetical protein